MFNYMGLKFITINVLNFKTSYLKCNMFAA